MIHLGYEVGTGQPVSIPCLNLAIAGQTQRSGKTTTLEALVSRLDGATAALTFVTKRGEGAFADGRRITPYFRDRADWQFVSSIIDATLSEKNKFLRSFIMGACRGKHSLAEVWGAIKAARDKGGRWENVYVELDEYFRLFVPEIERAELASDLLLEPGLNVMDVTAASLQMQMLYVRSALDRVNERRRDTIVVIPEAWEFVPNGRSTPVKSGAEALTRKGSVLGNHVWVDSQDLAAVDMIIRRGVQVWLFGVQRETNEIKRNIDLIPRGIGRPTPDQVALLKQGEFYACWEDRLVKVYVQPAWMKPEVARDIALGSHRPEITRRPDPVITKRPAPQPKEEATMCKEHARLARELEIAQQELQQETLRANRCAGEAQTATGEAMLLRSLRNVLVDIVDPYPGSHPNHAKADLDLIVDQVLKRIPPNGHGPITLTPPAKLRADFQREEVDRLLHAVTELSELAQRTLKILEAVEGVTLGQPTIAARLGRSYTGNSKITLNNAVKELVDLGLVESRERVGVRSVTRDKIAGDLSTYQATPEDIEGVYQRVLHELAGGTDGN